MSTRPIPHHATIVRAYKAVELAIVVLFFRELKRKETKTQVKIRMIQGASKDRQDNRTKK